MPSYLVVANQTLGSPELTDRLTELAAAGSCSFHLLVPVTQTEGEHQWDYPAIDRYVPDPSTIARALAAGRLEHELQRLKAAGVEATGEVLDQLPVDTVTRLERERHFDGLVIATLPHRLSRWMVLDLPHRLSRASSIPVIHVEASAGPSL